MSDRTFTLSTEDDRDELRCDECRRQVPRAVLLGSPRLQGGAYVCLECLEAAADFLRAIREREP